MNHYHRKILFWLSVTSLYALVVVVFFSLLNESKDNQLLLPADTSPPGSREQVSLQRLLAEQGAGDVSGVLLPLGPDDGRLPGLPEIWEALLSAGWRGNETTDADGFEGLQAVAFMDEYSRDAAAELFLSGSPQQVYRRGSNLIFLNSEGKVLIIDCRNGREPKVTGTLPFGTVRHMEMRGDLAYLLLSQPEALHSIIVVADLKNPDNPRQLARISLPNQVTSFYLNAERLVVSSWSTEQGETKFIELYALSRDYQVAPLGRVSSGLLSRGFLKFGEYLLVPDSRAGVHVCDFSDPLQPVVVASLAFPDAVRQFVQHDKTAFVMGGRRTMYVLDLEDPVHPVVSRVAAGANYPAYLIGVGDYTYYFTPQGYLQAFNFPPLPPRVFRDKGTAGVAGPLFPLQNGSGFALLGDHPGPLPKGVAAVFNLAGAAHIVDTVAWRGGVVVLQENGLVRYFRGGREPVPQLQGRIKLQAGQRWLAASQDRLYVGGQPKVTTLALNTHNRLVLAGQFEIPGKTSWDGLVVGETLCVAAGKDGILTFALASPDHPAANPGWTLPRHLASLLDVRQLAASGDNRVIAAAGPAGLLDGRVVAGQFQVTGLLGLPSPISTIAVINQLCLAATAQKVSVIDIRESRSLQNLGEISFPGVTRLVVAPPSSWAGLVPGAGWSIFPAPRLLEPGDDVYLERVRAAPMDALQPLYRLNLFDPQGVYNVPGFLHFSALPLNQAVRVAGDGN